MDNRTDLADWTLIRAFLAVAESGSLSAAAQRLGTSQPTVGRQIKSLEAQLGTVLFTRHARGLDLSAQGQALLPSAKAMQAAAQRLSLQAAGQAETLRGTVRITASQVVSHYLLPPVLAGIRQQEPEITIDLAPTDSPENLLFREADIAVRMFRSSQLDIVTRQLGELPVVIFASRAYLDRRGRPTTPEALLDHDLIGYDRSELIIKGMRAAGFPATRDWFTLRCDDQAACIELARAGCGVGFAQRHIVERDPTLEIIDIGLNLPALPVWLAAPQSTRKTPRIARIWDLLSQGLAPMLS
ncbi:LysR family transcriptional regulator [Lutimaribacter sp. EGI FJ00015]|uniref:LysR family transcriptional regulator n=1 Tax=Lutimaribacter degradans TaxID=2945989 RepID=A0ACC5ZUQ2_9RHOB|nr:LysR family transcriptional regulator [Lutimaribacter sp. EGI FJ00013]MCM2561575.1 LysR family transcriptional regulator [Lutimaribacter sp. EGI FJ00013]MCO0612714.1 LysR family transcriptional regulator [Lutimaribacter sp. EGI FJ00015]MCO0635372.1 LysR family transcriptional regulator [Lutimaribacter sp. EGI FJ00014]